LLLEYIIPAFLIGLGGSLHCIGMCGPLMFSSLISNKNGSLSLTDWVLYQSGRISIYAIWGIVFGAIGTSARWFGLQQNISLSLGIGILVILILTKMFPAFERKFSNILLVQFWKSKLSSLLQSKIKRSDFIAGMLNGILPCGLVYVALAGATSVQDPIKGAMFMIVFGIGTLPLLSALLFFGKNMQVSVRRYLTKWYPALIGLMAIMLIIRGMNLGNFFSPAILPGNGTIVHCEAK
jgi:sulfite exporter TauE/SafE